MTILINYTYLYTLPSVLLEHRILPSRGLAANSPASPAWCLRLPSSRRTIISNVKGYEIHMIRPRRLNNVRLFSIKTVKYLRIEPTKRVEPLVTVGRLKKTGHFLLVGELLISGPYIFFYKFRRDSTL